MAAACGGDDQPVEGRQGPLRLLAQPESIAIPPFGTREITFLLVDERSSPVPDRVIQFALLDDPDTPGTGARGATLGMDRGVTNQDGRVVLQVVAGLAAVFRVRASAARAPDLEVVVFVTTSTHGSVEVAPVIQDDVDPGPEITTVRLHLFAGGACAGIRFENLPRSATYPVRTIPVDATAVYASVSTDENHAAVGLGLDGGGVLRAAGCVDLPGAAILPQETLRLTLPLHGLPISAEGTFAATSQLQLSGRPTGPLADAWRELSECPLDPARLWLDCTIDALRTEEGDPLDCRPGRETPFAERLAVRRGVILPSGPGRCRDRLDSIGRASLEAIVERLFPAERPALLAGLPAIATEARTLLDAVKLQSTMVVRRAGTRDRYVLDHRLRAVEFPLAATAVTVELLDLGAPVLEARFVPGTLRRGELSISTHGFTLRLGSAARLAFARASLGPRGGPGDIPGFVSALFGLASRTERGAVVTGCAALDALVCGEFGEPRECLMVACTEGLAALTRRLAAGFQALDGEDLDLSLGGSVPLVDGDGDRRAEALGRLSAVDTTAGLWSGEVRGRGGSVPFTGVWTAVPAP